ncbi:hypothetical protein AB0K51_17055 [Kitasatospora sp. NPDC049285]|uniref:hypothetical protein n=1 Tax=Kitasatospora sp. NPDC049285 TaxID=3157096 RepID=UPI003449641B
MTDIGTVLKGALAIDGALGAALVDATSGMALDTRGPDGSLDLALAAAAATDIVRAQVQMLDLLGLYGEALEDILLTLTSQYHLIRPLTSRDGRGLFLYLVLDRSRANLAMARHRARAIEADLVV